MTNRKFLLSLEFQISPGSCPHRSQESPKGSKISGPFSATTGTCISNYHDPHRRLPGPALATTGTHIGDYQHLRQQKPGLICNSKDSGNFLIVIYWHWNGFWIFFTRLVSTRIKLVKTGTHIGDHWDPLQRPLGPVLAIQWPMSVTTETVLAINLKKTKPQIQNWIKNSFIPIGHLLSQ